MSARYSKRTVQARRAETRAVMRRLGGWKLRGALIALPLVIVGLGTWSLVHDDNSESIQLPPRMYVLLPELPSHEGWVRTRSLVGPTPEDMGGPTPIYGSLSGSDVIGEWTPRIGATPEHYRGTDPLGPTYTLPLPVLPTTSEARQ